NDKIFDEPVYNYTRDFPYIWEEIPIPITYQADRGAAERILLDCATQHTVQIREMGEEALSVMQRRYGMRIEDFTPKVFYRITDNWLELTVRFMVRDHGIRDVKDAMSRDILSAFDAAGIGIASATYDIVGFPAVRLPDRSRSGDDHGA
ncbi:MAG: mechanosensitive ion channel family protein, partial [Chloroflexota bacterium]|nr:mechanosensitive ion channel family protein [Chloroflexota bacterium]